MDAQRNGLPLAAYVRVSTAAQAASGLGLEAQRRAITEAGDERGFAIVGWYEDAGRSGATMRRRPGLKTALAAVAAREVGGLVVAKIDRLGRSSADVLRLVEEAQRDGWRLVALDVGLDTNTPAGELVVSALAMAARFEYRRISERQREKHDALRRLSRPRGRPATSPMLAARIAEMRDAGRTWQAIADMLNIEGLPTPRGGAAWRPSSVRSAWITRQRERAAQTR